MSKEIVFEKEGRGENPPIMDYQDTAVSKKHISPIMDEHWESYFSPFAGALLWIQVSGNNTLVPMFGTATPLFE